VIHEVDEAIRALIRRDVLNGSDVEVVFDAPTKDWSARRNTPTLDVYLYDIREDLKWRAYGSADIKGEDGHTVARQGPPKYFKLSYLVTAWTQRPEDEHRLLSAVLLTFLRSDILPKEVLPPLLRDQGVPVRTSIALPPPQDRSISDVWSAMGGEMKPSLDLICLVAIDARGEWRTATPVVEPLRLGFGGIDGDMAEIRRRRGSGSPADFTVNGPGGRRTSSGRLPEELAEEVIYGARGLASRIDRDGDVEGDGAGKGKGKAGGKGAGDAAAAGGGGDGESRSGRPGRIFRIRNTSDENDRREGV
jgi:hypothetical protein